VGYDVKERRGKEDTIIGCREQTANEREKEIRVRTGKK
jgi:hypothetical protein